MFAGIDVASERHTLARLDEAGGAIGGPIAVTEDREGYDALLEALGPPPALVAMEATGHCWKDLSAVLAAAGHGVAPLNPFQARRFRDAGLERTEADGIDARGLARLALEKRPAPTRLHGAAAEGLRELVRHRDRLRRDSDDRVRQPHRLVDLGFPELTRYVRGLDSMLATCPLAGYPTARAFARANPKRLAKLRYDGRHLVGETLAGRPVEAAERSVGQHRGPAYAPQARHVCRDLDLRRRRLAEIERDIEGPPDEHEVGRLLTTIEGVGPRSAARITAAVGDPARFRGAAAFAAHVGVVPGLKQSGRNPARRAACARIGDARLRTAPWMPTVGAVRRNPRLRAFYERLRAAGKPPKLALVALRKLLHAIRSVAQDRRPFAADAAGQARPA